MDDVVHTRTRGTIASESRRRRRGPVNVPFHPFTVLFYLVLTSAKRTKPSSFVVALCDFLDWITSTDFGSHSMMLYDDSVCYAERGKHSRGPVSIQTPLDGKRFLVDSLELRSPPTSVPSRGLLQSESSCVERKLDTLPSPERYPQV